MPLVRSFPPATPSATDSRVMVAMALGVCVGLSSIDHGVFEVLQGNTGTGGFAFSAIGPEWQMWEHGTEDAVSVVPNFLVTGLLAISLGALILLWSTRFIDRPEGARGLLTLGVASFLLGGGVGMIVFLVFGWAVARRIGRPARRGRFHDRHEQLITPLRPALVVLAVVMYVVAIWIAVTGVVPGVSDADAVLAVCWGMLAGSLATFAVALLGGGVGDPDDPTDGGPARFTSPSIAAQ